MGVVGNIDSSTYGCSRIDLLRGINTALEFYYKNLPKGFKRPDNIYQIVNENGVALNFNRRPLATNLDDKGYVKCYIHYIKPNGVKRRLTSSIHRLVAMAFIDNPNNLDVVIHKDGNKENNTKSNLELRFNI